MAGGLAVAVAGVYSLGTSDMQHSSSAVDGGVDGFVDSGLASVPRATSRPFISKLVECPEGKTRVGHLCIVSSALGVNK